MARTVAKQALRTPSGRGKSHAVRQLSRLLSPKVSLSDYLRSCTHSLTEPVAVLRLLVPRGEGAQVPVRPFDVVASDVDVLLELKPEGKVSFEEYTSHVKTCLTVPGRDCRDRWGHGPQRPRHDAVCSQLLCISDDASFPGE